MKFLKQLTVILAVSFAGEGLHALIPVGIPAGVYAMALLFAGLCTGTVKLEWVEGAADALVSIMTVMFLPALVGLMDQLGEIGEIWLPCLLLAVPGTWIVMAVSGKAAQAAGRKGGRDA